MDKEANEKSSKVKAKKYSDKNKDIEKTVKSKLTDFKKDKDELGVTIKSYIKHSGLILEQRDQVNDLKKKVVSISKKILKAADKTNML